MKIVSTLSATLTGVLFLLLLQVPGVTFTAPELQSGGTSDSLSACNFRWNRIPSPNAGPRENFLDGVSSITPSDAWAVGSHGLIDVRQSMVMHWDGVAWVVVPSPNLGVDTHLLDVAAVAADDVWAVGNYSPSVGGSRTLVEHWDGKSWSVVPSPNVTSSENFLSAVAVVTSNDVWAVGTHRSGAINQVLTLHWDGHEWEIVPSPVVGNSSSLRSVSAINANDVWAVGLYRTDTEIRTLALHWDGTMWTIIPTPSISNSSVLNSVAAVSSDDVWAVGNHRDDASLTEKTLITHWNGSSWSIVPSPSASSNNNYLSAVTAASANDIWAVGYYWGGSQAGSQILHWDGQSWSISSTNESYTLSGASALSSNHVWAVGNSAAGYGVSSTFIERYGPPTFTDVSPASTFYPHVECLACRGITSGYADGTFRPNNHVTRGQLSKIVSNSANFTEDPGPQIFEDVPSGFTFYYWVQRLARRGYISGYPCGSPGEPCNPGNRPYFRPNNSATRAQISKIVSNARGYTDPAGTQIFEDVPPSNGFYEWIQRLAQHGAMGGYECGGAGEPCGVARRPYFRPNNNATRGQTSKIVSNTFFPQCSP